MRSWWAGAALFVLPAYSGCSQRSLSVADAAVVDAAVFDFATPAPDLSESCPLPSQNASVSYGGQALAYAWFGDIQCDGSDGAVKVVLGTTPGAPFTSQAPTMPLAFVYVSMPLQLGPQTVEVMTDIGANATVSATLELSAWTPDPTYPGLVSSLSGRLHSADGSLDGSFVASHCSWYDVVCI